ncbi:MFS transporter [Conexibacter stalactiti]|uniref:MFS transporter n=1 Tax=Conexibacter stalactiti TaxID=1940611 RepID=A0ABU4HN56_9ACTN|nr:MFS transporter [Conexibacter stalactiti]MDW5594730.1 MFS transporter [Conexibacter stalactiti]MEC5035372.1 MFS transporter [Conexibacter stalactiti]
MTPTLLAPAPARAARPAAPAAPAPDSARARRHGFGFWAVAYAFLVVMAFCAVPTPLYAIYQARDGFSSFVVTIVFAAYAAGVVVSLFTVGHLSDWHGRRRVLIPALLLSIVSAVVFLLWHGLAALLVARVLSGLAVGAVTATATAWIAELHSARRPGASPKRAQLVGTAANLGGIGLGPLVAGMLAQWVGDPLVIPYAVSIAALLIALVVVALSPDERALPSPRPRYRPQRVSVPAAARGRYFAAGAAAAIAFATFGLFTSLAPSFIAGTLGHTSHALAGAAAFVVFAGGVVAQAAIAARSARQAVAAGIATLLAGLVVVVAAVWLPQPSLALFLGGGVVAGAGAGMLFKGAIATVAALAAPERRAEALAGIFLAGYIGISLPVIGLGVLLQEVAPRVGLLSFAVLLALVIAAAAPKLLGRS